MISEHSRMKRYCKDDLSKVENYDKAINDSENMWELHHRLEITLDGENALSTEELIRMNMYWHRPYFELIFLKKEEHRKLHRIAQKSVEKMIKANFGKARSLFGKKYREHYKTVCIDDKKRYHADFEYYKRNGKCRWEN